MENLTWKYIKPLVNQNAVEEFAKKRGISFPNELVACFKQYNGGRPDKKTFYNGVYMLKTLLSFNEKDIETVYESYDVISKEVGNNVIPFASDPAGNYVCYDANSGSVIFWLHETNETKHIADTFDAFLAQLH